ncbi:MAG: hypothetical protein CBD32_06560 [Actinobacteria bacterium TMED172]|nr:gliding motility-associated lipoprotein GldK [Cellvibrionales bacterium]OUW32040.1 MAG: hypothetical protein CBD32_06560 [Actinobacteria bacterium TMED172]|tara:strand:- start:19989 stop:20969 length:981 start_codon:yes stop_codon:yes gene_type:complete
MLNHFLKGIFIFGITFLLSCQSDQTPKSCLPVELFGKKVDIKGGEFQFGDNRFYIDESPAARATVVGFNIDIHEVTNIQFAEFVSETGFITDAEKGLSKADFPDLPEKYRVPGSMVFIPPEDNAPSSPAQWWQFIPDANWRHPYGPGSDIVGKENHPVVQLTYADAEAYAKWLGRRLPTEREWEFAARGGLDGAIYSWGDEKPHDGQPKANTWQGIFPHVNLKEDGFVASAPVGCYPPNGFGLFDTTGNVWEWSSTPYGPDRKRDYGANGFDPQQPSVIVKTLKGGSFLCADNYCQRYRPAARQAQDVTVASPHIGFRTVANKIIN